MKVKFEDFKIIPDINSIRNIEMDDETYFSKSYRNYVSNSGLKNINPKTDGSPEKFKNPPKFNTDSLKTGTYVHEILLQPESFVLGPYLGKPNAKLGEVIDQIWLNRQDGNSIYDSIHMACEKVDYFKNQIDKKIRFILENGWEYYKKLSEPRWKKANAEEIMLCEKDYNTVSTCLKSCYENQDVMNKLHPKNVFGEDIQSRCEDALFIDFIITYKDKKCARIPFKLKIDNWTIDFDEKVITLNDLKTTSKPLNWFMNPEYGSFVHYNYYRQMYCYMLVLWYYCQHKYGASKAAGWKSDCNILAVQTTENCESRCFNISQSWLKMGKVEWEMLMKRVAAYEIFGWEKEIDFS